MSKHFTRRDLIHAGCTIAGISLAPGFVDRAEALFHRSASGTPPPSGLSLRSVLNSNDFSFGLNEYAFIDHIKSGGSMVGPVGSAFATGSTFPTLIDANGWPNNASASGVSFGGGFIIPDPANFGGPYTIDFPQGGNGEVDFNLFLSTATWTVVGTPTNCSVISNTGGVIKIAPAGGASAASIQLSLTCTGSGPQTVQAKVQSTGGSGFFIKQFRWYRTADATDLAAGKIFRSAWKQPIVNLCPSAFRWMNNLGGNSNRHCRFENRILPSTAGYISQTAWGISPCYQSNATGTNQFAAAAATPTSANTKTTPTSMLHGEVATIRFTNGFARTQSNLGVIGISTANPAVVQTASAHGYSTNDIIGHLMPLITNGGTISSSVNPTVVTNINNALIATGMYTYGPGIPANTKVISINSGANTVTLSNSATISANIDIAFRSMQNLHMFPTKITVVDPTHYSIQTTAGVNIDGSTLGTFSANGSLPTGASGPVSYQFITLQVGSGSDRTPYPCLFGDGYNPASVFGQYLVANDYKTWYFDKTISGQTDGSGNYILGAWMFDTTPSQNNVSFACDFPIEVCVALINELNAMSPAHTIGLWLNLPCWGLNSMDPDYTTASDFALNMIDVVMNPSSAVRTSGFSALGYNGATQLNQPNVIVEYSNELWPSGTNDGRAYLINKSIQRYGQAIVPYQDWQDMKALRSTLMARAIKAANPPGLSRMFFVLGMWGVFGLPSGGGDGAGNYATVFGGSVTANPINVGDWYTNDTLVTAGSWGKPIDNHQGVCPAIYIDLPDSYYSTTTGTGTFTDDSAMFNGTNNSGNGGGNYTGAANPSQALTNFVNQTAASIASWAATIIPQYSSTLAAQAPGKVVVNYEGLQDWQTQTGKVTNGGHTLTAGDSLFSIAAINSSQWATAVVNFFNALNAITNCFMPSQYIWIGSEDIVSLNPDQRWANCAPDSYATITGTPTEGAALTVNSPVWIAMGNRNVALPN